MKKRLFILPIIMFLAITMGITGVKAGLYVGTGVGLKCEQPVVEEGTDKAYIICDMGFEVTDTPLNLNTFKANFKLNNVTLDDSDIKLEKDWSIKKTDATYDLSTTQTTFNVGYHKIATIKFYKINKAEKCNVTYSYQFSFIDRTCSIEDGKYYDKDGNQTDELTYQKQCKKNVCVQLSDGTYWGINGTQVNDKEAFDSECGEKETKHYCEYFEENYYGKNGEQTTKIKYELECENYYCTYIVDDASSCEAENTDGTDSESHKTWCNADKKTEYYFNKAGENVKKSEYEENCFQHVCSIVNGHYYNAEGKKVDTEDEYKASCEPIVVEEKHSCEIVDGKYYGKDGNVLEKKEDYDRECKKHSCEIVDNKYFDKDGNEVSKTEYEKLCPNAEKNPNTGSFLPILPLIILMGGGVAIYFYTKKDQLV